MYILDVGITQFGNLYDGTDAMIGINDLKNWVLLSTNNLLYLNISYVYTPEDLTTAEFHTDAYTCGEYPGGTCYWMNPNCLTPAHNNLVPQNCAINFILWNNGSYEVCQAGSDWGPVKGSWLQVWDTIPINPWWITAYSPDICSYSLNAIMTHEMLNMMHDILNSHLGFTAFEGDTCGPCTVACRTQKMGQITTSMCESMIANGYSIRDSCPTPSCKIEAFQQTIGG